MATITEIAGTKQQKKILRTAAYCRVSSDSLDQLHSFAAQVQHYTKAISQNPSMELADIYADEGLTGTKTDKRDDFNRLIADCRKGKIDRVLTKSVSRFARNTVDSLMYARMLKEYGVSILFEKENIDTAYMSSELLLALSGAQAQEESISISKNMRWSVERRMKSGTYLSSSTPYGYKLEEGEFKVVETEAEIVRLQKTYIVDCISKKSKKNTGELPMYYVENNHTAIIERAVFDRVQEEVSRRNSKRKVKDVGTKTELGKYSGKYALTELLFCGNCGTPYRRTTWSKNGRKKIVWRCISRLDYGTKYCKNSPSIEEGVLQNAIAAAITRKAQTEGANVQRIREHIEMYLNRKGNSDLKEKQERLVSLRQRIDELTSMDSESAQNGDFDELFESLYTEMYAIKDELEDAEKTNAKLDAAVNRIDEMTTVMYGLKNHPVEYDEQIVRQLISSIKVVSAEQILILFKDGTEMTADL